MKKEGLAVLIIFTVFAIISVANAATFSSESVGVNAAYQCLQNATFNKTTLSLQESVFTTLALGYKNSTYTIIEKNRKSDSSGSCWPTSACTLKDTAQVALAYSSIKKNTSDIEKWLLGKTASVSGLQWYLEIDATNHQPSSCTVDDGSGTGTVQIGNDMKLTGSGSSCLTVTSDGYFLSVSQNCLGRNFTVSCDQDFITTLLYRKTGGDTIYVSSDTHGASSLGHTNEQINAKCFGLNGCDYEGSLWTALALQKTGNDVTQFLPYLLAMAEDNRQYLPSAFLYIMAGGDDWYSELTQQQKQNQYWQATLNDSRFYDTSLALLALYNSASTEKDNAKTWLLNIQGENGCWNNGNIRDTAMVLWAGWPNTPITWPGAVIITPGGTTPVVINNTNITGTTTTTCSVAGYSCTTTFSCLDAGGNVLNSYDCNGLDQCCSVAVTQESCSAQGGVVCASNQQCSGQQVSSTDGSCCLTACQNVQTTNTCESLSVGTCRNSCFSDEQESTDGSCSAGQVCCAATGGPTPNPTPSRSLWWLWLLLGILILLIIIGILYRDKLRIWLFKMRGKIKPTPVRSTPVLLGGIGPRPIQRRPLQIPGSRPMITSRPLTSPQPQPQPRPQPQPQPQKKPAAKGKDSEYEETLKKLREMSK